MASLAAELRITYGEEKAEIRARVTAAFRSLRKQGLIARSGFGCCRGCAGGELATYVENLPPERQARVKGAVFYTTQDKDAFVTGNRERAFQGLWLTYGDLDLSNDTKVGLPTVEVGTLVVKALTDAGLATDWNGNPDQSVKVTGLHPGLAAAARCAGTAAALAK